MRWKTWKRGPTRVDHPILLRASCVAALEAPNGEIHRAPGAAEPIHLAEQVSNRLDVQIRELIRLAARDRGHEEGPTHQHRVQAAGELCDWWQVLKPLEGRLN